MIPNCRVALGERRGGSRALDDHHAKPSADCRGIIAVASDLAADCLPYSRLPKLNGRRTQVTSLRPSVDRDSVYSITSSGRPNGTATLDESLSKSPMRMAGTRHATAKAPAYGRVALFGRARR
jgi:hypothetical protein